MSASVGGRRTSWPAAVEPARRPRRPARPPAPARGAARTRRRPRQPLPRPRPRAASSRAVDRSRSPRSRADAGVEQELDVAVGAGERGRHGAHDGGSERRRARQTTSSSTRRQTTGSVITPRPRAASSRPASNWGFTRSTRSAPGATERRGPPAATVRSEMNDRSATSTSAGGAEVAGRQVAHVRALAHLHPRVGAQPLVELAVADVDGHDRGRAPLQEAVGEPAGRRAEVERPAAGDVDARTARGRRRASRRRGRRSAAAARARRRLVGRDEAGRLRRRARRRRSPARRRCPPGPAGGSGPGPAAPARRRGGAGPGAQACFLAAAAFLAGRLLGRRLLGRRPSWRRPSRAAGAFWAAALRTGAVAVPTRRGDALLGLVEVGLAHEPEARDLLLDLAAHGLERAARCSCGCARGGRRRPRGPGRPAPRRPSPGPSRAPRPGPGSAP